MNWEGWILCDRGLWTGKDRKPQHPWNSRLFSAFRFFDQTRSSLGLALVVFIIVTNAPRDWTVPLIPAGLIQGIYPTLPVVAHHAVLAFPTASDFDLYGFNRRAH